MRWLPVWTAHVLPALQPQSTEGGDDMIGIELRDETIQAEYGLLKVIVRMDRFGRREVGVCARRHKRAAWGIWRGTTVGRPSEAIVWGIPGRELRQVVRRLFTIAGQ